LVKSMERFSLMLSRTRSRARFVTPLKLALTVAVLAPLLLLGVVGTSRYQQTILASEQRVESYARIGEEHASKVFDANQVLLDRLLAVAGTLASTRIQEKERPLHDTISALTRKLPQVQSVWILDETGRPLLTDRFFPAPHELDLSDRPSFQAHRSGFNGLFITDISIGKKTQEPFFDMTRGRVDGQGRFLGTVQVSLHPSYFDRFYREMVEREPGMTVSLIRSDGAVLARWPRSPDPRSRLKPGSPMLRMMTEGRITGAFTAPSTVDGIEKISHIRKLPGYPVYVFAGLERPAAIRRWRDEMLPLAVLTLAFSAAVLCFGRHALRAEREQRRISRHLREEIQRREGTEKMLRQAQKMEVMGHLSGGVAHDFNNLLMVIQMNIHLLSATQPQLSKNARVESIQRAVAAGAKLTRQLLSFSRRQPLAPEAVDWQERLRTVEELCEPVLGRAITTHFEITQGTPAVVLDIAELELALLNLAINSKHAMPEGGRFSVNVQPYFPSGSAETWAEIRVSDTGTGIPRELIGKIFDPFFTTKQLGKGTGLGLGQVQSMCQRASGTVGVESEVGRGTTFLLRFPGASVDAQTAEHDSGGPTAALPRRILFVEDNLEIAQASIEALRHHGCQVHHCETGRAAQDMLITNADRFDIVMSDIVMPGEIDGVQLAQHIRAHYPALPVVLISGYTDKLGLVEDLGIPVLSKPFNIESLKRFLAAAVGAKHVRQVV
jgi:signal transduction histidine kinase/ActR/RegA family two-component response regulator